MLRQKKEQTIDEVAGSLSNCTIAIATDYRGLSAKEMVQLRQHLTELGIEYRVIKNTLTRFAAEKAGRKQFEVLLGGPLAVAFGYDDVVKPAQALSEHIRTSGSVLRIKGGLLGERLLTAEEVSTLAATPPRGVLLSQLVGQLQSPLQRLHNVLNAPLQGFVSLIQARIRQVEGG